MAISAELKKAIMCTSAVARYVADTSNWVAVQKKARPVTVAYIGNGEFMLVFPDGSTKTVLEQEIATVITPFGDITPDAFVAVCKKALGKRFEAVMRMTDKHTYWVLPLPDDTVVKIRTRQGILVKVTGGNALIADDVKGAPAAKTIHAISQQEYLTTYTPCK